jgi:hypothetical protein
MTLVLLVSKVNISPISSSDTPALAFGDAKRLSRGRDPFVLILQDQIMENHTDNQINIGNNAMATSGVFATVYIYMQVK